MKELFGKTFQLVERAIEVRTKRNTVISANIANVDTPGFRAKDINFSEVMAKYMDEKSSAPAIARTHSAHLSSSARRAPLEVTDARHFSTEAMPPEDAETPVVTSEEDGIPNNVDLDQEMAKLSVNNLEYQVAVQALIKHIEGLRTAITEGGKA
jgi:flagellar basal-body rod protein FlgB